MQRCITILLLLSACYSPSEFGDDSTTTTTGPASTTGTTGTSGTVTTRSPETSDGSTSDGSTSSTSSTSEDSTSEDSTSGGSTSEGGVPSGECFVDGVCAATENAAWCPWDCGPSFCNWNGELDLDEQCDDGNHDAGDGCDGCMIVHCGDLIVDPKWGEECDEISPFCLGTCEWIPQVACVGEGPTCDELAALAVNCLSALDWESLASCLDNIPEPGALCDAILWQDFLGRVVDCEGLDAKCWDDYEMWPEWSACWSCGDC